MVQRLICDDAKDAIMCADKIDIICIGTPRVIGDSVGPRVGTLLKAAGLPGHVNVVGCMDEPVHRGNLHYILMKLRQDALLVCVDAALNVSYPEIVLRNGMLHPGSAITDELPKFGDITILCRVGESLLDLHTCSEDYVCTVARDTAEVITTMLSA